jgi:hypothetical protein
MTIQREEPLAPAMHLTVMRGGHVQPEAALDAPEEQMASAESCWARASRSEW